MKKHLFFSGKDIGKNVFNKRQQLIDINKVAINNVVISDKGSFKVHLKKV